MTIESINNQQPETLELGWDPEQVDMALQRINWLRSMGLVTRQNETHTHHCRTDNHAEYNRYVEYESYAHSAADEHGYGDKYRYRRTSN